MTTTLPTTPAVLGVHRVEEPRCDQRPQPAPVQGVLLDHDLTRAEHSGPPSPRGQASAPR